ncbi:hypothetical protein ACFV1L_27955 [Kitasatospora sp. NPDC059646]|uniref:hypothetical protein n=1 Tax=Kitasatospora sp. NPDC059646 TaxID=3346893 RepID=UPI0036CD9279
MAADVRVRGRAAHSAVLRELHRLWEAARTTGDRTITQKRLARLGGIGPSTLNGWLTGRSVPRETDRLAVVAGELARAAGRPVRRARYWAALLEADRARQSGSVAVSRRSGRFVAANAVAAPSGGGRPAGCRRASAKTAGPAGARLLNRHRSVPAAASQSLTGCEREIPAASRATEAGSCRRTASPGQDAPPAGSRTPGGPTTVDDCAEVAEPGAATAEVHLPEGSRAVETVGRYAREGQLLVGADGVDQARHGAERADRLAGGGRFGVPAESGEVRVAVGGTGQAIVRWGSAWEQGVTTVRKAVEVRKAAGRIDEAVACREQRGAAGDELAWQEAAAPFARQGRCGEPQFAYLGDPHALRERAEQCERDRDLAGALHWYRKAAGAGSEAALFQAADMLERNGDRVRAVHWYELAARRGDVYAMRELGRLLGELGRTRESAAWYRVAVRAGGRPERSESVGTVEQYDRQSAATQPTTGATGGARPADPPAGTVVPRSAGRPGPAGAAPGLADSALLPAAVELLKDGGRYFEADLLLRSADRPEQDRLREASRMLCGSVASDGAVEWVQRFADTGDRQAVREAAEMLENRGRIEEALDWYARAAADGDRDALVAAARMLADRHQVQRALDWYRRATDAGVQTAEHEALIFRQQVDAAEERAVRRRREREQRTLSAAPAVPVPPEAGGATAGPSGPTPVPVPVSAPVPVPVPGPASAPSPGPVRGPH